MTGDEGTVDEGTVDEAAKAAPWWRSFVNAPLLIPVFTAVCAVLILTVVVWQQDPAQTADRAQAAAIDAVMRAADRTAVDLAAPRGTTARFVYALSVGKGALLVHRLAPIGADRVYAVWVVSPTGPLPAGTFRPDSNGDAAHLVALEAAQAVGVEVTVEGAVEGAGGGRAPSGETVIHGDLPSSR